MDGKSWVVYKKSLFVYRNLDYYICALQLLKIVEGPKKLGVFGASYLYPVFVRLGVIKKGKNEIFP